ncbi:MAG: hypothetical protein J5I90_13715 [Caldilineales bacterium]|nr:hypothetical protein [Caldilineales bacterium]
MRRFNRGYALGFLFIIIVSIFAVRGAHQRVEGRYQKQLAVYASYSLDDWLELLQLDEILGDPPVTPVPADQIPATPTPPG